MTNATSFWLFILFSIFFPFWFVVLICVYEYVARHARYWLDRYYHRTRKD